MSDEALRPDYIEHKVTDLGFNESKDLVVTFDVGPSYGQVIIRANVFAHLVEEWETFKRTEETL